MTIELSATERRIISAALVCSTLSDLSEEAALNTSSTWAAIESLTKKLEEG